MKIRNVIGAGLAAAAILAGLVTTPAQADQTADKEPGHVAVVLDSAATPVQPAAFADCDTLLCLWDNEWYEGRMVRNSQSGNLGPSFHDEADSFRNKTGYWIVLFVDVGYKGHCIVVPPLDYYHNMSLIGSVYHDSISSVLYFLSEGQAKSKCFDQ